jgi:hypothetical protein
MAAPSSWLSTIGGAPIPEFAFLRASGQIEGAQQQLQMEDRPGVDGFIIWRMGLKGPPFQMQTETDFTSRAAALAGYVQACAAVGQKRVLFRYGESLGEVAILGCSLLSIQPSVGTVNGLNIVSGGSGVVMTLGWTVRGVA